MIPTLPGRVSFVYFKWRRGIVLVFLTPKQTGEGIPIELQYGRDADDTAEQQLQHHAAASGIEICQSFFSQAKAIHEYKEERCHG